MKSFTLESAQEYLGDPQAIRRGSLSQEILEDAEKLAHAVVQMPTFGKLGYLGEIGSPEQWWVENCPGYGDISSKYNDRQFSFLTRLTEEMISQEKQEAIESRWQALELLRKLNGLTIEEEGEYLTLKNFL